MTIIIKQFNSIGCRISLARSGASDCFHSLMTMAFEKPKIINIHDRYVLHGGGQHGALPQLHQLGPDGALDSRLLRGRAKDREAIRTRDLPHDRDGAAVIGVRTPTQSTSMAVAGGNELKTVVFDIGHGDDVLTQWSRRRTLDAGWRLCDRV
jgi:1,6-anhydro-N-acetylmuramate kinase